jgi:hypothetical protein
VTPHRWPIFVVILLVLAGLGFADHQHTQASREDVVAAQGLMPIASPPQAVSSSFFCAGGTAVANGTYDSTIVIANPNDRQITTTLTVYPAAAPGDAAGAATVAAQKPVVQQVAVGSRTRVSVRLATVQQSPFAAAMVETSDPDVAVEHQIMTKQGVNSSPCASAPSRTWYFPTGTTTRDSHQYIAVFNPFSADAVVDITYQTNDGFRAPDAEQGLPITAGHLRIVDVSADVPRLEQLAAFVSVRSGQVVADRLQAFDGSDPNHPAGAAATLGAPEAAPVWTFPHGEVNDGISEVVTVMNPGNDPAQVQLEIALDNPDTNGQVDPIPLTVAPRSYGQVVMQDQTRVPKAVTHSIVVRSLSGNGVVAERVIRGTAPAPAARHGYGPSLGSPLWATRWLFPDGAAVSGASDEALVVFNPSRDAINHVALTALAQGQLLPLDGLQDVEVQPGGRVEIELGPRLNRPDLTLIAQSTEPSVMERSYVLQTGLSWSPGVPLSGTTSLPH